jgi:hypothetical protein
VGVGLAVGVGVGDGETLALGVGDVGVCGVPPPPLQPLATRAPSTTNG